MIDLFVWWEKWVVEKPVSPWMDSVWSVWEIGTITVRSGTVLLVYSTVAARQIIHHHTTVVVQGVLLRSIRNLLLYF